MSQTAGKMRAVFFSVAEQTLLMGLYEEYKDAITKKGNTVALNKAREKAWQKITDILNALLYDALSRSQDVRAIYKRKLLLSVEREKLDIEYKKLLIKKTKLEIKKLQIDLQTKDD